MEGDSLEEGEFREEAEGMGMLLDDGAGHVGGSVERKLLEWRQNILGLRAEQMSNNQKGRPVGMDQ